MAETKMSGGLPPSAITHLNRLSADEASAAKELLAERGVRLLPYPFASALAIVSDVDNSRRHRYDAYIGQIVDQLGLDFGDSIWLTWNAANVGSPKRPLRLGIGLGFLTPWLTVGRKVDHERFTNTRTFTENLVEYHKGNIDHFHSFFMRGIRVVPIKDVRADEFGRVTIDINNPQDDGPWSCKGVFALAVCVVGALDASLDVKDVSIKMKNAALVRYGAMPAAATPDGRKHQLFTIDGFDDDSRIVPAVDEIESITFACASPEQAASVDRVLILNAHTDLIIDRLRWLREKYNVEMSLITEHSRFHFSDVRKNALYDSQLIKHFATYSGPVEAYNGGLTDVDGRYIFSTHCDEPHSFGRMFPELSRDLEYRFVNPIATMSPRGWDPLEVVTPSATRTGGGIYYARRTRPSTVPELGPKHIDRTPTRQETLAIRVRNVLDEVGRKPGLFCPLYTHLGSYENIYEDDGKRCAMGVAIPEPYFDVQIMRRLQDCIFNITGSIQNAYRVWFSRATTHYDYALMLRNIGGNIARPAPDTVAINSWMDACLGKPMPRSAGQLYGLTFYVDDPARAEVLLDGAPIEHLYRNPPDETGRGSVTIAACDLRYTVFEQLDPAHNWMATAEGASEPKMSGRDGIRVLLTGAQWAWRARDGADRSFGRLRLSLPSGYRGSDRVVGSLRIPMFDWTPTGAQALSLLCRSSGRACFGLLIETRTGGMVLLWGRTPRCPRRRPHHRDLPADLDRMWRWRLEPFHNPVPRPCLGAGRSPRRPHAKPPAGGDDAFWGRRPERRDRLRGYRLPAPAHDRARGGDERQILSGRPRARFSSWSDGACDQGRRGSGFQARNRGGPARVLLFRRNG